MGGQSWHRKPATVAALMQLKWTQKATSDLGRLYDFLASVKRPAAVRVINTFMAAPKNLLLQPRMGEKLEEFEPREIRRIFLGQYEMRYEIQVSTIHILRIWHSREDR